MHLYQKVPTVHLAEIQTSIMALIDQHGDRALVSRFNDPQWYLDNVPALKEFLNELGITQDFDTCYLTTIGPQGKMTVHLDISDDDKKYVNWCLGLNIPIQNTENSRVIWYDQVQFDRWADSLYSEKVPCFVPLNRVGELQMLEPHWIRVNVPHNVENYSDKWRVLLSLRFRPEPLHVWQEPIAPLDVSALDLQPGRIYDFK